MKKAGLNISLNYNDDLEDIIVPPMMSDIDREALALGTIRAPNKNPNFNPSMLNYLAAV